MADFSVSSPSPLSRMPSVPNPSGLASAKTQIEQVTNLLKEINQLAPHIKETITMFTGKNTTEVMPNDPQGLRSRAEVEPRVVEKIVYQDRLPTAPHLVEMLIQGLSRLEDTLGTDMPLGEVKKWTIQNRKAIELAVMSQSKSLSPSPDTSPTNPPKT